MLRTSRGRKARARGLRTDRLAATAQWPVEDFVLVSLSSPPARVRAMTWCVAGHAAQRDANAARSKKLKRMTILFYSQFDDPNPWRQALARELPDIAFRVWPDVGDAGEILYALVWKPPPGLLKTLPNLRAILSLGAGVDGIFLVDPAVPVVLCRSCAWSTRGWRSRCRSTRSMASCISIGDMHRYAEQQRLITVACVGRSVARAGAQGRCDGIGCAEL